MNEPNDPQSSQEAKQSSLPENSSTTDSTPATDDCSTQTTHTTGRSAWPSRRANSAAQEKRDRAKIDLVWLAGFIDGEGHFSIHRNLSSNGSFTYHPRISVTNTNYRVLAFIRDKYGGSLSAHGNSKTGWSRGWRKSWRWQLSGDDAYDMAVALESHLIVKGPAIRHFLIFCRYKEELGKLARPKTLATYFARMKRINKRGTVPPGGKIPKP